jgi:hypothetical protein
MVMVAAGADEGRGIAHSLGEVEAQHVAVKCERPLDVRHLQVHVTDVNAWVYGAWLFHGIGRASYSGMVGLGGRRGVLADRNGQTVRIGVLGHEGSRDIARLSQTQYASLEHPIMESAQIRYAESRSAMPGHWVFGVEALAVGRFGRVQREGRSFRVKFGPVR